MDLDSDLKKTCLRVGESRCYPKRMMFVATYPHLSFGMTTTQYMRDLFALRHPLYNYCGKIVEQLKQLHD